MRSRKGLMIGRLGSKNRVTNERGHREKEEIPLYRTAENVKSTQNLALSDVFYLSNVMSRFYFSKLIIKYYT